jgi:hypothetical protein
MSRLNARCFLWVHKTLFVTVEQNTWAKPRVNGKMTVSEI